MLPIKYPDREVILLNEDIVFPSVLIEKFAYLKAENDNSGLKDWFVKEILLSWIFILTF